MVMVSSIAYKQGIIDFEDLDWSRRSYDRMKCYGDSKLANLLFMNSLNRLSEESGAGTIAVAAHPGLTGTERQQTIGIGGKLTKWLASPVRKGVLPQLLASTDPQVGPGEYYGPRFGLFGKPVRVRLDAKALDTDVADRLWTLSERVTGFSF